MKLLKLVNDERKLVCIKSKKACDSASIDICISYDTGKDCSLGAYDWCGKDFVGCSGIYGYDDCNYDYVACQNQRDVCGTDFEV